MSVMSFQFRMDILMILQIKAKSYYADNIKYILGMRAWQSIMFKGLIITVVNLVA